MCARAAPPCARIHGARAARDRSGSVEEEAEEEKAGQRCWSCGNDGAERGDDTSLILYKVGPMWGQISAANAMKNIQGEKLLLFSSVAAAFCVYLWVFSPFPNHSVSGAHLKRSHTMSGSYDERGTDRLKSFRRGTFGSGFAPLSRRCCVVFDDTERSAREQTAKVQRRYKLEPR